MGTRKSGEKGYRFPNRYLFSPPVGNIDTLLRNGILFPHTSECPPILGNDPPRGTQSAVSIKANTYLESAKAEEHPSGIFIAQKYRLLKTLIFSSSFLTRKNGTFGVASS